MADSKIANCLYKDWLSKEILAGYVSVPKGQNSSSLGDLLSANLKDMPPIDPLKRLKIESEETD